MSGSWKRWSTCGPQSDWTPLLLAGSLIAGANGLVLAGPHEGGTVILHANPSIAYSSDSGDYCGQSMIDECADAVTSVPADPATTTVFFALAAFPEGSSPELVDVTFGIDYDPARFVLLATGHCADLEGNTSDWPLPGSGTAVVWNTPQHELLLEMRWFAGYAVSGELASTFELSVHPTEGGFFGGDGPASPLDEIADYGKLGFGMDGYLPCPDGPVPTHERSWGGLKTQYR